jgi:serine/alanine adding enzyme
VRVVKQLDETDWRAFVDSNPNSHIFHTPEMFQVFARTKGYRPSLWAAMDSHNRPLALLLPVEITLMGGPFRRFTTRAVAYASVLCAPSLQGQEALRTLLQTYRREVKGRILFTELRNLSDLGTLQPVLHECGFAYEEHLNFIVDLARPQEDIWKSIRSNARRNVRKARKLEVAIEDVEDPCRLSAIYDLLKQVYRRIQVPLADVSFFRASFEVLRPKGMMKILAAKVEDVDIGALTLLLHKDVVLYWYTGTLREYAAHRAGDLLVWHTLEWGSRNGFRLLDFGGAGKPDEDYGVRDFKAKFGGRLVSYGRNTCVHAPVTMQVSRIVYEVARRFLL